MPGVAVSRSMAKRKAASVFPEPVGAWIRTWPPAAIAGQPCSCAGVGAAKFRSNQARVSALKTCSGSIQGEHSRGTCVRDWPPARAGTSGRGWRSSVVLCCRRLPSCSSRAVREHGGKRSPTTRWPNRLMSCARARQSARTRPRSLRLLRERPRQRH